MPMVKRLIPDTYLALINNSIGTNLFRNHFGEANWSRQGLLRDGDISCGYFVSGLLYLLGLIKEPHLTVAGTLKDLETFGWYETKEPKQGTILLWDNLFFPKSGEIHAHLGFYIGDDKAVSNSNFVKTPKIHDYKFRDDPDIKLRESSKMYWHPKLDGDLI